MEVTNHYKLYYLIKYKKNTISGEIKLIKKSLHILITEQKTTIYSVHSVHNSGIKVQIFTKL